MQIDSKLQVAEQSVANQFKGLRSSLTDNSGASATGNLSDLIEELDTIRSKLEEERKSHEKDNANLSSQLAKMEEESYSQIDQSLKLEEAKAQAEETIASLQNTLESERSAHEAEVNILMRKSDNAEQALSQLERKEHEKAMQLREELEHARDEIERYKLQTEKLQQRVAEADEELATVQATPPLSPTESIPPTEEEQMALSQDEITALLKQLSKFEKENKLLKSTNEEDILKLRTEHEKYCKETEESFSEKFNQEMASLRKDYECKIEQSLKEMERSRSQQKATNDNLVRAQAQLETMRTEVHKHTAREGNHVKHIQTLEETGKSQKLEITQLRADVERYQNEIAQLRHVETVQKSSPPVLSTQRHMKSPRNGIDEPDYVPAPISPKRLSHSSDVDSHDRIITAPRRGSEENPEQILVQQLVAGHSALRKEMERTKQSFDEEKMRLSDQIAEKDVALTLLKQKSSVESIAIRSATQATTDEMLRFMSVFNSSSNKLLSDYKERVEVASSTLVAMQILLQDKNSKHTSMLADMMSDIRHSKEESKQVRQAMERTKQELEAKHEQEIHNIRNELDKKTILEEQARVRSGEVETQLMDIHKLLQEREQEVASQAERIRELELRSPVNEHVEALQYVQMQPLESVNETLFLNTNRDSREILTIKEQVSCVCTPHTHLHV